jgi:uncharacterized membrane protein YedE/YeeE
MAATLVLGPVAGSQLFAAETGGTQAAKETAGYAEKQPAPGTAEKTLEASEKPVKKKPVKKRRVRRKAKPNPVTAGFIVSGLLVGMAAGFVLQRGRFCMNSAFRDTIFIKDFTFFRSYIIALMVMVVGANIINDMGIVHLARQPFWFLAQIVGGYLFGMGMVLAGGCGSGIWYRVGEGLLAAWVAVLGFFLAIAMTSHGILKPVFVWLRSFKLDLAGQSAPALHHLVGGGPTAKWAVIAVLVVAGSIFVLKGKPFAVTKSKGFFWSFTGLLFGLIGIAAFWASEHWGGFPRGLSFTTPTRDLFFTLTLGDPQTGPPFKTHALGNILTTWPGIYMIGVPLGAFISAKILKEFTWKTPPAKELLTVFGGSLMMGFGATVGGGCNVGQALTGFSTLSIGSIVATIFIILGNWTMVYFKFIKPMQDLDID